MDIPNKNGIRTDVVNALKEIHVPVVRWPGGCFVDTYHWQYGIGPKESRRKTVNRWGHVIEDNHYGTHEYFEFCEQLGSKSYVNCNVATGTPQEATEWVEYMTCEGGTTLAELRKQNGREVPWKLDYFGIGNEPWGGSGGLMRAEYYADLYRQYHSGFEKYAAGQKICAGANGESSSGDPQWTEEVLNVCCKQWYNCRMDGLSLHYYALAGDWDHKGPALDFGEEDWYALMVGTLRMETLIRMHGNIMDTYDPDKRIGLMVDEWGALHDVEEGTNPAFFYHQSTMRDAVSAALTLNIFNKHCDRVKMACLTQAVNACHSDDLCSYMVCIPADLI